MALSGRDIDNSLFSLYNRPTTSITSAQERKKMTPFYFEGEPRGQRVEISVFPKTTEIYPGILAGEQDRYPGYGIVESKERRGAIIVGVNARGEKVPGSGNDMISLSHCSSPTEISIQADHKSEPIRIGTIIYQANK